MAELTHHVHYGDVTMKVSYAQAYYIMQAIIAAQQGNSNLVVVEGVSLGFDDIATNYLLVGPGTPIHVQGPPITEIADELA